MGKSSTEAGDRVIAAPDGTDGRTARRTRNRAAVLDAVIQLAREGEPDPSVDEIAERAGVSYRSVYRYFEDRVELVQAAVERVMEHVAPLYKIDDEGQGTMEHRARKFVSTRLQAYRELAPITRAALQRSANEPLFAAEFGNARRQLRRQLEHQFANELDAFDTRTREARATTLDLAFQFEALEYLAEHCEKSDREITTILVGHIERTLARA